MNLLGGYLSASVLGGVGWALVHFLWQGTLVALALAALLRLIPARTSHLRYLVSLGALVFMAAAPLLTFQIVYQKPARAIFREAPRALTARSGGTVETSAVEPGTAMRHLLDEVIPVIVWPEATRTYLEVLVPWLAMVWLAGVLALSMRLAGSWVRTRRLTTRYVCPVDDWLDERLEILRARLRVSRTVRLLSSNMIDVPTVIGWLRPCLLLPASALIGLSPTQLEAVIAHELAHIRRHDYLVNLFQCVVDTFLFYHPAVWWVSERVRAEREHCCDDIAVEACGNARGYARALTELEHLRVTPHQLAMGATGGSMLYRIRRLLNLPLPKTQRGPVWLAFVLTLATVVTVGTSANATRDPHPETGVPPATLAAPPVVEKAQVREHNRAPRASVRPTVRKPRGAPAARAGAARPVPLRPARQVRTQDIATPCCETGPETPESIRTNETVPAEADVEALVRVAQGIAVEEASADKHRSSHEERSLILVPEDEEQEMVLMLEDGQLEAAPEDAPHAPASAYGSSYAPMGVAALDENLLETIREATQRAFEQAKEALEQAVEEAEEAFERTAEERGEVVKHAEEAFEQGRGAGRDRFERGAREDAQEGGATVAQACPEADAEVETDEELDALHGKLSQLNDEMAIDAFKANVEEQRALDTRLEQAVQELRQLAEQERQLRQILSKSPDLRVHVLAELKRIKRRQEEISREVKQLRDEYRKVYVDAYHRTADAAERASGYVPEAPVCGSTQAQLSVELVWGKDATARGHARLVQERARLERGLAQLGREQARLEREWARLERKQALLERDREQARSHPQGLFVVPESAPLVPWDVVPLEDLDELGSGRLVVPEGLDGLALNGGVKIVPLPDGGYDVLIPGPPILVPEPSLDDAGSGCLRAPDAVIPHAPTGPPVPLPPALRAPFAPPPPAPSSAPAPPTDSEGWSGVQACPE